MAERDPWETTAPRSAKQDPWEGPLGPSSVGGDIAKSAGTGVLQALTSNVVGLPGNLVSLGRAGAEKLSEFTGGAIRPAPETAHTKTPITSREVEEKMEAAGVPFHEPETNWGNYAQAIAGGAADPLNLVLGPGNIIRRLAVGGLSGAGGELGGKVAGPAGAAIGAGLTSAGTERSIAASQRAVQRRELAATAPTQQAVDAATQQQYRAANQMTVPLSRADVSQLGTDIRQDLIGGGATGHRFSPINQPKTFREIEKLENQVRLRKPGLRRTFGAGGPIGPGTARPPSSSDEVLAIRDSLQDIRRDNSGTSEATAASHAIDRIDQYLDTVSGVNAPLREARANYRPARRAEDLDTAITEAIDKGGNLGDALRTGVRRILQNDSLPKTPQEVERMRAIVRGGGIPRQLAQLTGHHAYLAVWLLAHGHPIGALESIIPGIAGRGLDARRTREAIEDLRDDILRSSPAGGGAMPTRLPPYTPGTGRASAARAIDDALRASQDDALQ